MTCSQWAPDGLYLASGSSDKSAKLWGTEGMRLEEGALASGGVGVPDDTQLPEYGQEVILRRLVPEGHAHEPGGAGAGAAADPMAAAADQRGSPRGPRGRRACVAKGRTRTTREVARTPRCACSRTAAGS